MELDPGSVLPIAIRDKNAGVKPFPINNALRDTC